MRLAHLSLVNFRNYARLELSLDAGITLVVGDNAQGKSNLLESIYFLAATKSFRSGADRELINWLAAADDVGFARVAARVQRERELVRLEIVVKDAVAVTNGADIASTALRSNGLTPTTTSKQLRVNGTPKRGVDFIGQANVVMFSPQDIELITGAPQLRRRYLDVTISQVDPAYVRALGHYNKVLAQRNHLLRTIREGQGNTEQLFFWDQELTSAGGYVIVQRRSAVTAMNGLLRVHHSDLTESGERLHVVYRGSIAGDAVWCSRDDASAELDVLVAQQVDQFRNQLSQQQAREIAYGMSLLGPHRDDLGFYVDDRDAAVFGSRGQQRTVVLSLKLAEAAFMRERTGEEPIVLLDDIMSELDPKRGHRVLASLRHLPQVLITATDLQPFERPFLTSARLLRVQQGLVVGETSDSPDSQGRLAGSYDTVPGNQE